MNKRRVALVMMIFGLSLASCKSNSGHIIAKIGKEIITEATFDKRLASMPREYRNYARIPSGRKQLIDAIVREAIVVEAAKKAGVDKKKEYKNSVKNFKLKQQNQFVEYKNGLLVETYVKDVHKKFCPTELDIQVYYDANRSLFENPKSYTVRHILVHDLQTAKKAYVKLQSGENFERVAKEFSNDNAGLIGPFKRGELVTEFEQAVVDLKDNEISTIVETPYGYHIILKVSEEKLLPIPFKEAKEEIKRTLEKERFNEWFAQKKQEFKVEVRYDALTTTCSN